MMKLDSLFRANSSKGSLFREGFIDRLESVGNIGTFNVHEQLY